MRLDARSNDSLHGQLDHVVGELSGPHLLHVPRPSSARRVELKETVLEQRAQEDAGEERIAAGLADAQVGQRRSIRDGPPQRCRDQLGHRFVRQRSQFHVAEPDVTDSQPLSEQMHRMTLIDLVVAVSADHQQRTVVASGESLDEVDRGRVCPLQVIEHDHRRMVGRGDRRQKQGHQTLETVASCGSLEGFRARNISEQGREFGHDLDQRPGPVAERVPQLLSPGCDGRVVFHQELAEQIAERRGDRPVGGFTVELVELADRLVATAPIDRRPELLDETGLPDARVAMDEAKGVLTSRRVSNHASSWATSSSLPKS